MFLFNRLYSFLICLLLVSHNAYGMVPDVEERPAPAITRHNFTGGWTNSFEFSSAQQLNLTQNSLSFDLSEGQVGSAWGGSAPIEVSQEGRTVNSIAKSNAIFE